MVYVILSKSWWIKGWIWIWKSSWIFCKSHIISVSKWQLKSKLWQKSSLTVALNSWLFRDLERSLGRDKSVNYRIKDFCNTATRLDVGHGTVHRQRKLFKLCKLFLWVVCSFIYVTNCIALPAVLKLTLALHTWLFSVLIGWPWCSVTRYHRIIQSNLKFLLLDPWLISCWISICSF